MDIATNILVVDDEPLFRELLSQRLQRRGYRLIEAGDGAQALSLAEQANPELALVDINMPGMDGIELLRRLKALDERMEVVILTGCGAVDTAISAMKLGAYDYLTKPYKLSELELVVGRALEKRRLAQRCAGLSAEVSHLRERASAGRIGISRPWQELMTLVEKTASLDVPVLITGPSGAGKEVVAQALHELGKHRGNPFVPLNCGLLQENLLESELFGHKKGAFTGAVADKEGLFHTARDGTLFLDEIGEMPEPSQAKLLRVLETGEYRPLGGTQLRRTNARLIAATNRDLEQRIAEGHFRQDLLYRLNVITLQVPALRDRREDIPLLVEHFMLRSKSRLGAALEFTPAALARLVEYPWPGNIRELRNVVERILILNEGDQVEEAMVAAMLNQTLEQPRRSPSPDAPFERLKPLAQLEQEYVRWAAEQCGGNLSGVARELGVSRSTVYRILKSAEELA